MQEKQEIHVRSLGWEDPLEEEMATHSIILAQRIPWTEEPGRLESMGLQSQTRQILSYVSTCILTRTKVYALIICSYLTIEHLMNYYCVPDSIHML